MHIPVAMSQGCSRGTGNMNSPGWGEGRTAETELQPSFRYSHLEKEVKRLVPSYLFIFILHSKSVGFQLPE